MVLLAVWLVVNVAVTAVWVILAVRLLSGRLTFDEGMTSGMHLGLLAIAAAGLWVSFLTTALRLFDGR
jgi:hypothetical protein